MYKFLAKNGQLMAFGLGALVTVIFLVSIFSGLAEFVDADKEAQYDMTLFNFGITASIALAIIAFIVALGFGILQFIDNPKGSLKGLLGIVAIIVVFFVGQSMAGSDGNVVQGVVEKFGVTAGQSGAISGGIITVLVLIGIAVLAFIISEVSNFLK